MKNIYITGFMGSGKTYFGFKLSKFLKYHHFDSDRLFYNIYSFIIYKQLSYRNILIFRKIEKNIIKFTNFINKNTIISTGGGCILNKLNNLRISKHGINLFLKKNTTNFFFKKRPLVKNIIEAKKIYKNRILKYDRNNYIILINNYKIIEIFVSFCLKILI